MLLQCSRVAKVYQKRAFALANCNFAVAEGSRTAVIGANGAGKTTLLNLLLGTIKPSAGAIAWFGRPLRESLPELYDRVAFVPEEHSFYRKWTGQEVLALVRSFHANWDATKESQLRELLAVPLNQKVYTYSKGMLVKLSLLLAFSQGATVLVLDEPFAGLDPLVREELLRVIRADVENNSRTLILTSHDLFAVEVLTQDLWILHKGRFIFQGSLDSFLNRYRSFLIEADQESPQWTLPQGAFVRELSARGTLRRCQVVLPSDQNEAWLSTISNVGIRPVEHRVALQDAYSAYLNPYTENNNA